MGEKVTCSLFTSSLSNFRNWARWSVLQSIWSRLLYGSVILFAWYFLILLSARLSQLAAEFLTQMTALSIFPKRS